MATASKSSDPRRSRLTCAAATNLERGSPRSRAARQASAAGKAVGFRRRPGELNGEHSRERRAGQDRISRDSEEFRTNTQRLAQFAEAVDDTNPHHRSGRIASPVFHHVPVMQSMVEVLKSVSGGFLIHGEHDFIFQSADRARAAAPLAIEPGGDRATERRRHCSWSAPTLMTHDGKPVCTQYATCLVQNQRLPNGSSARPRRTSPQSPARASPIRQLSRSTTSRPCDMPTPRATTRPIRSIGRCCQEMGLAGADRPWHVHAGIGCALGGRWRLRR